MVSVALLMDWLGHRDGKNSYVEAAAKMSDAVAAVLADAAARTPDLGGKGSTKSFGDAVAARIAKG